MHPYPHLYVASASGQPTGPVGVTAPGLPAITTAPPTQFDGPGDVWSPETLLCASIADCFILTFRAMARAARFEWTSLSCRVEGVLEKLAITLEEEMFAAAEELRFEYAAKLRDEIKELRRELAALAEA